jgi:leucyl-tRNA synthetase
MKPYDHKKIEKKWQQSWDEQGIYTTENSVPGKENYFTLVEFSYPSGNLHVGHWYAFSVPDIFARYKRMKGFNVLYPMGFDAFGLPAENAAIKLGADPKVLTYEQMDVMRAQLRSMGAMFDWDREIVSCDPEYYKWTQWMFNQFLKNDLVYRAITTVNWCPKDQTVLANEQVTDGKCERCGSDVVQRNQEQWMLRITKYADRLIDDLDGLNWPHAIKESQKNWIGRSEGSEIIFKLSTDHKIKVFTTRADTLFGVTYVVLAPEHTLVQDLKSNIQNWDEVQKYISDTKKKSELDRQQSKEKTGVQLKGVFAINPANNEQVPVWIADYVLAGYGTGAVMAVPAHDERDFEFATKYDLPVNEVIISQRPQYLVIEKSLKDAEDNLKKFGTLSVKEIDKDWGRFWYVSIDPKLENEFIEFLKNNLLNTDEDSWYADSVGSTNYIVFPNKVFKISYDNNENIKDYGKSLNIPNEQLDWELKAFTEEGTLVNSGEFNGLTSEQAKKTITEHVGGKLISTYRLRDWGISRQRYWGTPIPIVYDPEGNAHPIPDEHLPWVLPTDVDHTPDGTAPLARSQELIERTEKIFGKGWRPEVETMDTFVDSSWYFYRYLDPKNSETFASEQVREAWMPIDLYMGGAEHTTMHLLYSRFWVKALYDLGLVKENESYTIRRNRGLILGPDGNKMSKSKGNVINPDEIVELLGADTVRLYLAFMGPYGVTTNYPWDPNGVVGVRRFLERVWKAKEKISDANSEESDLVHKAIKGIGEDIEEYKFNTAISKMMVLVNHWDKQESISKSEYILLLQLLAPFAPHMSEELWNDLGNSESIHTTTWPVFDVEKVVDDMVTLGIQVNGKVRAEITIGKDTKEEDVKKEVMEIPEIQKWTKGKEIKKFIYIAGKIISIVI